MLENTTLEPTAVSRIRPSSPIFGRRSFDMPGGEESSVSTPSRSQDNRATDATGLSFSSSQLAEALDAFEREQAARAPERAYRAAGEHANRQPHAAAFSDSAFSMLGQFAAGSLSSSYGVGFNDVRPAGAQDGAAPVLYPGAVAESEDTAPMTGDGTPEKDDSASSLGDAGQKDLADLKARDAEVRRHEQAHIAASGGLAVGGASYSYESGPDGRMYAVAGEVQIDTSKGATPDETIEKARRIRSAALAPAEPSGQDRNVAAQASRMESEARAEKSNGTESEAGVPSTMHVARLAYEQARGVSLPAPYGTGLSFAV